MLTTVAHPAPIGPNRDPAIRTRIEHHTDPFSTPAIRAFQDNSGYSADEDTDSNPLSGPIELGLISPWGVASGSFISRKSDTDPPFVRLGTTFKHDIPEWRSSLRLGDSRVWPGKWGQPVHFGGLQWTPNYKKHSNSIPLSLLGGSSDFAFSGADIYSDPAGADNAGASNSLSAFSTAHSHSTTGLGVQLRMQEVMNRAMAVARPGYITRNLLRTGLSDYSYEAGFLRENFGLESNDYGLPFASGTHRYGFSRNLTGEARAEILEDRQTLGISAHYLWRGVGAFNFSAARSLQPTGNSRFYTLGFARQFHGLNIDIQSEYVGQGYAQLGRSGKQHPTRTTVTQLGLPLERFGALSLSYTHRYSYIEPPAEIATVGYSVDLPGGFALSLFARKELIDERGGSLTFSLTR